MTDEEKFREQARAFAEGHWTRDKPARSGRWRYFDGNPDNECREVLVYEVEGRLLTKLGSIEVASKKFWWWSAPTPMVMPDVPVEEKS